MCCRLRLDLRELRKKAGGYFGSGESTGSIGVVTLNLPHMAYLAQNETDFYTIVDHYMDIAARSLDIKRKVISRLLGEGLYPYTKRYLGTFDNHFSTIGLIGMNEAVLNARWMDGDLTQENGRLFAATLLRHMRTRLSDYQEQYGTLFNLEATPAESTTYRFAKHDVAEFPDIITAAKNDQAPYYTNSSHLPVGYTDDIFDALEKEDELQTLYTSGTVFHAFLGERLPDWKSAAALVKKIAENFQLPYYTLSPTYSVCAEHGYIPGEHFNCPICGKDAEVYSRITGYYRPIKNWNYGKAQEYKDRKTYNVDHSIYGHSDFGASCEEHYRSAPRDTAFAQTKKPAASEGKLLLFTTRTCPNCRTVKLLLERAGVAYDEVLADDKKNSALVGTYGIRQVPTLVVNKDGESGILVGLGEIKKFIDQK